MSARTGIRVGIVGYGFMGRTHAKAYRAADRLGLRNAVVAISDLRRPRSPSVEDLLADPRIDLVSICTPTDSHVDLAIAALAHGKHVLVEKPIALRARDAQRLASAAKHARGVCMPAMCIRFWPGWDWLAERIAKGTFGAPRSVLLRRLGTRPDWSGGFYEDARRSGGALVDLHVHDADFVRFAFGAPRRVRTVGSLDHLTTAYEIPRGPAHVVAEGGWDHARGYPFRMSFTVVFEDATADFDSTRPRARRLFVARRGRVEPVAIEPWTGWDGEVRHVLRAIARGTQPRATCDEAVALTRMLEAERRSLASGRAIAT